MRFQAFNGDSENYPDWADKCSDEYQMLLDMENKTEVCCITEPEDRTFNRDLSPIIKLLNKMDEELKKK
jgi:hypothetical protein